MFAFASLAAAFLAFLFPGITNVKPGPVPPAAAEMNGALPNQGGLVTLFNALVTNAAPAFGNWGGDTGGLYAASSVTYQAADMVGGLIKRSNTGVASATDSTDTGTNIFLAIPGAVVNQTFPMIVANLGSGSLTMNSNTGVSILGTNIIDRFSARLFVGKVTGSNLVTLTNQFEFSIGSQL